MSGFPFARKVCEALKALRLPAKTKVRHVALLVEPSMPRHLKKMTKINPGIDCVGCIWPQDGVDFRCFGRIQQLNNVGIDSSRLRASKRRFQALAGQGLGSLLGPTERRRIPPFWPHPAAKQRRNRQSKAHGVQTSVSGTRTRGTGTAFGAQQPRGFSSTRSALSIHLYRPWTGSFGTL